MAEFDVAGDGTLVYALGVSQAANPRTLVWVDRQGREAPVKGPERAYLYPRISPDGTRVVLDIREQENDLWMWDLARATLTRLTFDPTPDRFPLWMRDGRRLTFSSDRAGVGNLYTQAADGTGAPERLTQSQFVQFATSISPDGVQLVVEQRAVTPDLMLLSLDSGRASSLGRASTGGVQSPPRSSGESGPPLPSSSGPRRGAPNELQPLLQTQFSERNGEISPDGRWLAYEANNSNRYEIYVRPFPDVNAGLWQVSTSGGIRPAWARNGRELFYVAPTGAMMAVPIEPGPAWKAGTPTKLFDGPYYDGGGNSGRTYDVSPDGRRFLMIKPVGTAAPVAAPPPTIMVVQNWFEELKRLVPTR